jgi:hypothetical protein
VNENGGFLSMNGLENSLPTTRMLAGMHYSFLSRQFFDSLVSLLSKKMNTSGETLKDW